MLLQGFANIAASKQGMLPTTQPASVTKWTPFHALREPHKHGAALQKTTEYLSPEEVAQAGEGYPHAHYFLSMLLATSLLRPWVSTLKLSKHRSH